MHFFVLFSFRPSDQEESRTSEVKTDKGTDKERKNKVTGDIGLPNHAKTTDTIQRFH